MMGVPLLPVINWKSVLTQVSCSFVIASCSFVVYS